VAGRSAWFVRAVSASRRVVVELGKWDGVGIIETREYLFVAADGTSVLVIEREVDAGDGVGEHPREKNGAMGGSGCDIESVFRLK
jgi:hypothetical protein